jgi:hypothetical protein
MSDDYPPIVGRVLRASTRGFDCGAHSRSINNNHDFGIFVKAPVANSDDCWAIGLIYKVEIKDDQLIAELVLGDGVPDNILRDQRDNRMIPVEVKVLCVGYMLTGDSNYYVHSLPPRPPMSLSDVLACSAEEIYDFTHHSADRARLDFFRLVLQASEVPSDDLIAAAIKYSATIFADDSAHYEFLVQCGRRLARDLSHDMKRLAHILALIEPAR